MAARKWRRTEPQVTAMTVDPHDLRPAGGIPCRRGAVDVPDEKEMEYLEHDKRVDRKRLREHQRMAPVQA